MIVAAGAAVVVDPMLPAPTPQMRATAGRTEGSRMRARVQGARGGEISHLTRKIALSGAEPWERGGGRRWFLPTA
jgi:hypothetical protein